MKKLICLLWVLTLVVCAVPGLSYAADTAAVQMVDAGNKFCPVSGDKVSGEHFVTFEGKRYGLCCPQCAKKFEKDPAKYIVNLGNVGEDASSDLDAAGGHAMHENHTH